MPKTWLKRVDDDYLNNPQLSRDADYKESNHLWELMQRNTPRTPDFLELKLEGFVPVFVYGTLKVGGRLFHYLRDQPYLGEARTASICYKMYDAGSFPVVCRTDAQDSESAPIIGDVFAVNPKVILDLDQVEDNGRMYHREDAWVFLLDQDAMSQNDGRKFKPNIKAKIYIGHDDFWKFGRNSNLKRIKCTPNENDRPLYVYDHLAYKSRLDDKIPF